MNAVDVINACEPSFIALSEGSKVNWLTEKGFIMQALENNWRISKATETSLRNAVLSIARTGISINPSKGHAHIEVRNINIGTKDKPQWQNTASLKISYTGQIEGLTASGDVLFIRADVVRQTDVFVYHGPAAMPDVTVPNAFGSRGDPIGCYALAKLPSGQILCEIMRLEELAEVERCSAAESGPWKNEFKTEMYKKSVINRFCKTIPASSGSRISAIVSTTAQGDGIEFDEPARSYTDEEYTSFHNAIENDDGFALIDMQLSDKAKIDLFNTFPEKKKTESKDKVRKLMAETHEIIDASFKELVKRMDAEDVSGALEILDETSWHYIQPRSNSELDRWIADIQLQKTGS